MADVSKIYKKAKKTITLNGKKYYLYSATARTEKEFRNLILFLDEKPKEIKILLDINSDVCLAYGSKDILKLLKEQKSYDKR